MRRRNMYYATGLPGWMRFGDSPGWGGMPPGAQYLMTGQWPTPQAQAAWQAMQAGGPPPGPMGFMGDPGAMPGMYGPADKAAQLAFLQSQLQMLQQQLQAVNDQIAALEEQA